VNQLTQFNDIILPIEVVLDQITVTVGELLALGAGSVVKLRRSAGENIDIMVSDALVGYGEIVVIEDMMGVRITDFRAED
jgi:flagellar motor switch protein FliN/FliY